MSNKNITIIVVTNAFFIGIAVWIFQDSKIDLDKTNKLHAKIIEIFESRKSDFQHSLRSLPLKKLVIKLDKLDQYLTYYRPFGDYEKKLKKLHVGDWVTVFYKPQAYRYVLYRVERKSEVVISETEWAMKEKLGAIYIILVIIVLNFLLFRYFRLFRNKR